MSPVSSGESISIKNNTILSGLNTYIFTHRYEILLQKLGLTYYVILLGKNKYVSHKDSIFLVNIIERYCKTRHG